ncbi:MAG: DUF2586 family protein [Spirochaetota bacterium]
MGILNDVDFTVRDGALGRALGGDGTLALIGVGSIAQSEVVSLGGFDDVKKKIGYGPLRDFLVDFFSETRAAVSALVLPASTVGTVGSVTAASGNSGVGGLAASGAAHNAHKILVEITEKGGLNGAAFRLKVDGLLGEVLTVPQNGSYREPISGVSFSFSAGSPTGAQVSFAKGDSWSLETTAPKASNAQILAGLDKLKHQSGIFRHIAVVGVTDKAFWAAFAQKLEEFSLSHKWTWGSVQARYKASSDSSTDAYVNALAGLERGSTESKRLMICGSWYEGADSEGFTDVRPMHGKLLGRIFAVGVATSPGWVALGAAKGMEKISPFDVNEAQVKKLTDAGYATLRCYDGLRGVYFYDSFLAVKPSSDFATSTRIEVLNKAMRLVRTAQLPYLRRGFDVLPDGRVPELSLIKSAAELALDKMVQGKEISGYEIILADTQNILATEKVKETIKIVPRGQVNAIEGVVEFANPANAVK